MEWSMNGMVNGDSLTLVHEWNSPWRKKNENTTVNKELSHLRSTIHAFYYFWRSNLALSLGDKLTARLEPFLHSVHVNMKPCSGMRHVQNIGMPVTFNTGFFTKDSFPWGKTVVFLFSSPCWRCLHMADTLKLTLQGSIPGSMLTIFAIA